MTRYLLILACLAAASYGCTNNDTAEDGGAVQVAAAEPEADEDGKLEAGESLESEPESREAILAVLKGVPSPPSDEPLKFNLIRAIDQPLFLDRDGTDGPEQWITVAEVQDADGNVLWFDRVNSLYQLLEFLQVVLDQQSNVNFNVNQVFNFLSMQYPQLLEFAVKIPLGIEGATHYVLKVPKLDGELYEALRVDIDELVANAVPPTIEGEPRAIVENGPPEDRIDVVILGDGYTAEEREKFDLDAQAIAERLIETEPIATNAEAFNIHTVWTPSEESGAGYDCTGILTLDRGCKDDLRDTPFETVFVLSAIADRFQFDLKDTSDRVAMPLQVARLYDAASHVPFDEIIMVSNTRRTSGFAGLYVSVLTAYDPRLSFPDTAVHEFGHSFGVLGDEYDVEGDPCLLNEPRIPLPQNIAATSELDALKWSYWVDEGAPLPTPGSERDDVTVGAFQGAYNCDELFRPSYRCKMRNSDHEFCPVCAEQMVQRIHSVIDPTTAGAPFTAEAQENGAMVFTAPVRDEVLYTVTWTLGETVIGEGPTLQLEGSDVPTAWTQLRADVSESSGFTRSENARLRTSHSWWVKK